MLKLFLIIVPMFSFGFLKAQNSSPIFLSNKEISIGILPDVGGRIIFFGTSSGENLLKSDSSLWQEPEEERIGPSPFADFKAYNGFITWVGPQSEWWAHQSLNKERLNKKSNWPPDPYLIYGNYQITSQTDTSISLIGPPSPITGIQFHKKYQIKSNNLLISISAKNISSRQRSIDIWANARFDGFTKHMIPASMQEIKKIQTNNTLLNERVNYRIQQNMFSFIPDLPSDENKVRSSKAYINGKEGKIYVFKNNACLIMSFTPVPANKIHPEHGFIEVFNKISHDSNDNLLELEHHSPYKTLKPGEKMELRIKWTLIQPQKRVTHSKNITATTNN